MFKKLLSNLPFNPSLIHQVAFYSKRLRQESSIRRLGFVFISLTMALQLFAAISPAEAGNSCDSAGNDIIHCGFSTREEALTHCQRNDQSFGTILSFYGGSCDAVAKAGTVYVKSTDKNRQLYSVGRRAYGKQGEFAMNVPGVGNLYWRPLWTWDSGASSTYKMLSIQAKDGAPIWIMFDCGNLVVQKGYQPPQQPEAPKPKLNIIKKNNPSGDVTPGSTITYTLLYSNAGGTAAFASIFDDLPANVTMTGSNSPFWKQTTENGRIKFIPDNSFAALNGTGSNAYPVTITVKVGDTVPDGTQLCNKTSIVTYQSQTSYTTWAEDSVCNTVRIICGPGEILTNGKCEKPVAPTAACIYLKEIGHLSRTKVRYEAKAGLDNATVSEYVYNFGDGKTQTNKTTSTSNTIEHEFKEAKSYDVSVTLKTSLGDRTANACKTTTTIKPEDKTPMIVPSKKAKNITQKLEDATAKKAAPGDVIEYSVTTSNFGEGDAKNYPLAGEDLNDVLQYAHLDTSNLDGGTFDQSKGLLSWNKKVTIKAGQSVTRVFRVTVDKDISTRATPASNGASYDYVLSNTYGNTINIELPKSVSKIVEQTTTSLPNTGPGTSLALGFGVTVVVGYFFARSRLLSEELSIVAKDYASSGGGL